MIENGQVIQVGNISPDTDKFKNRTHGRVYDASGLAPTVTTSGGGGRVPLIVLYEEEFKHTTCEDAPNL
jgi:hypothetical protein